ncbi:hypothetical protein F4678DRAFT_456248 [Xylaria arbuscula]|nr:hypothetical protein F4678DRAFT_456248 [Xylaria arbuscula]
MPLFKPLPSWPNSEESIGRQISSSRVVIQPEIETSLKALDLGHADLFVRLYMIGRVPENANPIVMICSISKNARESAEVTIRESGLLKEHEGFGLGAAALPLEHPAPVRRLSPGSQGHDNSARKHHAVPPLSGERPQETISTPHESSILIIVDIADLLPGSKIRDLIFASSTKPQLGRRIFSQPIDGELSDRFATAGVIVKVGGRHYQLTAGHSFNDQSETFAVEPLPSGLEECRFHGQSDGDENDSGDELESTSRGSATPEEGALSLDKSSGDSTTSETTDNRNTEATRPPVTLTDINMMQNN